MRGLNVGLWGIWSLIGVSCMAPKQVDVDPTLPEAKLEIIAVAPESLLVETTGADEPSLRGRALELLILGSQAAAGGVYGSQALGDPDPWIQQRAVEILSARLKEPETVKVLSEYIGRTDSLVNVYAQGAAGLRLVQAGKMEAVQPHLHRYKELKDQPWSVGPLALMAAKAGDPEALGVLSESLRQGELPLEVDFLMDVGLSGLSELRAPMEAGQEWIEEELALFFALARMALGDVGGEHILRLALGSDDESIQMEALDALIRIPGTDHLLQRAASQRQSVISWYGELALVGRGLGSVDVLSKAIVNDNRMVREFAATFAGQVSPVRSKKPFRVARQVIKMSLTDEDAVVRSQGLKSAVVLNLESLKSDIQQLMSDEVLSVRLEAAGALLALDSTSP